MKTSTKRCAIYTRKSTEEGLEQEFNSLHAQREACVAYIISQKSEGWSLIKTHYDDGGFTGGNMDRPALKQMIEDIKNKKIDIIVVYKIDRLTRSLMDFAKLVEVFDQHEVTFVSVTQSFNTTTSMGRLTLNVLLSFAQFEREVISERVRDKIAASKQKGMWMGGNIPLGYDVEDRKLVINKAEAETVRLIYNYYLKIGSVLELKDYLDKNNIKSKNRKFGDVVKCGVSYSRGALYAILSNPVYTGKTRHKGNIYEGQHDAIIDQELWDKVQAKLIDRAVNPRSMRYDKIDVLLKGKIFDCEGNRYSPSSSVKNGRRHRYYISQNLLQNRDYPKHIIARIPADGLEDLIIKAVTELLKGKSILDILGINESDKKNVDWIAKQEDHVKATDIIKTTLKQAVVHEDNIALQFNWPELVKVLSAQLKMDVSAPDKDIYAHSIPFSTRRAEKGALVIRAKAKDEKDDPFDKTPLEMKNWVRGIVWRNEFFKGTMIADIAKREEVDPRYVGRLIDASLNI